VLHTLFRAAQHSQATSTRPQFLNCTKVENFDSRLATFSSANCFIAPASVPSPAIYLRDECIPVHRAAATWPASGHQGAFNNAACQGLSSLEPARFLCDGCGHHVHDVDERELPGQHTLAQRCAVCTRPAHSLTHSLRIHPPTRPSALAGHRGRHVVNSNRFWNRHASSLGRRWTSTCTPCAGVTIRTQHEHLHEHLHLTMQQSHRGLGIPQCREPVEVSVSINAANVVEKVSSTSIIQLP
jgi:hypothetical protein